MSQISPPLPLLSPEWLVDHLNYPHLVIIDCRFRLSNTNWGYQQYQQGHIPNAVYLNLDLDLSAPIAQHGGRHPLPTVEQLAATFSRIGITDQSLVVAYDSSRFAFASRLWWLLRYLGHEKVALLDGGWTAWQKDGYPISNEESTPKESAFIPHPHQDWIVDRDTVQTRKDDPSVILVDSRSRDRYLGKVEPIDPIAGSISGAVNMPWQEITTEEGYCKSLSFQEEHWQDYHNKDEIIVYCGSGVTACVNLFSLEMLGIPSPKLYVGGWSDWCSYTVNSDQ
ncbi:MAG: sulfurtransferase [Microcystaceae cyanobacterium]